MHMQQTACIQTTYNQATHRTLHTYREWWAGPDAHLLKAQVAHKGEVALQDLVVHKRAQAHTVGSLHLWPEVLDAVRG